MEEKWEKDWQKVKYCSNKCKKINDSYINSFYHYWFRFDLLFSLKKINN